MIGYEELRLVLKERLAVVENPHDWLVMEGVDPDELYSFLRGCIEANEDMADLDISMAFGFCLGWAAKELKEP